MVMSDTEVLSLFRGKIMSRNSLLLVRFAVSGVKSTTFWFSEFLTQKQRSLQDTPSLLWLKIRHKWFSFPSPYFFSLKNSPVFHGYPFSLRLGLRGNMQPCSTWSSEGAFCYSMRFLTVTCRRLFIVGWKDEGNGEKCMKKYICSTRFAQRYDGAH